MIQWSTNRVSPATAARTAMPGMTRQSTATAPLGSRGAQVRAAGMHRSAPEQRGAAVKAVNDDEDDRPDDEKEPLFSRDEPTDDETDDKATGDDGKPIGHDTTEDDDGNESTDPKGKTAKTAAA